jgi:hypothetical protein
MWTYDALETKMDVVERGTHERGLVEHGTFLYVHFSITYLNGKTKFKKMGREGVLTTEVEVIK